MNAIKEIAELGLKRLTPYVRECETLNEGDIVYYTFLKDANMMYFEIYRNGNSLPVLTPIDIAIVWTINNRPDLAKLFKESDDLLEYGFTDDVLKKFLDYYLHLFQI